MAELLVRVVGRCDESTARCAAYDAVERFRRAAERDQASERPQPREAIVHCAGGVPLDVEVRGARRWYVYEVQPGATS